MTGATFLPNIIGHRQTKMAIAVGILEETTTLDTIRILHTVEHITRGEMHGPFQCQVHPFASLILHSGTNGQVECCLRLLGFSKRKTQSHIYIRCNALCPTILSSCAVFASFDEPFILP